MSTFESSYKSLLQGVSQQIPRERLPGQLTAQLNMLADPVTNLRRRPGAQYLKHRAWLDVDAEHILGWFTDVAGERLHVLLNTNTGEVLLLDGNLTELAMLSGGEYLQTTNTTKIRAATVGNEFFICNTEVLPALQYGDIKPPKNGGFFYVVSGAFSKGYDVTLNWDGGELAASYTTPSGASGGDAALSTPEYIASQLAGQLQGTSVTAIRINSYTFSKNVVVQSLKYNGVTYVGGTEVTVGDLKAGKLGLYAELRNAMLTQPATFYINYEAKTATGWVSGTYTTVKTLVASYAVGENVAASGALAVSDFVAKASSGTTALLYVERVGPYVYAERSGTGGLTVNTTVSTNYLIPSKAGIVSTAGNLPARLPTAADGFICRVGTEELPQYFKYNAARIQWLEVGKEGSPVSITNMPVSLYWNGSAWAINTTSFEGRNAGDDETNKPHEFCTQGITGMATYQGRLVLMSGPMVSLSASGKPRRFFRSTVTSVVDSDPIEIGSGMNSSAAYEHAIPFQKDLVLLSSAYQAVIPSNNTAITPRNATVVPTSSHEVDVTSPPIALGRTLMYAAPRSEDFFGVREMVPSPYTDSQYVSHDATPHLPKYMGGRCRFSVSSSVANMALFAPSGDLRSLIVHEYMWDGDQKVQQAWHTWTFPYDVATAYFAYDKVIIVFAQNNTLVVTRIDPRIGVLTFDSERRPFLDLWSSQTVTDYVVGVPAWMRAFDPAVAAKLQLTASAGNLAGDRVGATVEGDSLRVVRSFRDGAVAMGVPYRSSFSPTPPVVRDYNDVAVSTNKATLLRYILGTKNSQEFKVRVVDRNSSDDGVSSVGTLLWSSLELELGRSLYSTDAASIIPCRTNINTTVVDVYTEETGELNAVSLEYVLKTNQKIKRR